MRLRWYYEKNLKSFLISRYLIKTRTQLPRIAFLKINLRHWLELDSKMNILLFWILLILTRQIPTPIRNLNRLIITGFFVTLRGNTLLIFLDKFINFIFPLGDQPVLIGTVTERIFNKWEPVRDHFAYLVNFSFKGLQEYIDLQSIVYFGCGTIGFLREIQLIFFIYIFCKRKRIAVCLLHMLRLPLKFRL